MLKRRDMSGGYLKAGFLSRKASERVARARVEGGRWFQVSGLRFGLHRGGTTISALRVPFVPNVPVIPHVLRLDSSRMVLCSPTLTRLALIED